jgi:3-hydroxybutyryl-CoA dehydrogenase
MNIETIAIIGAGSMGCGIAQAAASSGFMIVLEDTDKERAGAGLTKIEDRLAKKVAAGKLENAELDDILARIKVSASLEECASSDLVIEAVLEKEIVKSRIFKDLDKLSPPQTIFASNTSSISITRLAGLTARPEQFIGMHFMNPAHVMRLVEVIKGLNTSTETVKAVISVAERMGKTPVVVADSPGFVSNRILMPMINDAIFCLQEGVSSRENIDSIVKLGANHPMGPLELADLIGLDICLDIMEVLHAELGDKYRPCPLLRKMVAGGRLGKKNGEGFYEYN